jgi:hypothetical protein
MLASSDEESFISYIPKGMNAEAGQARNRSWRAREGASPVCRRAGAARERSAQVPAMRAVTLCMAKRGNEASQLKDIEIEIDSSELIELDVLAVSSPGTPANELTPASLAPDSFGPPDEGFGPETLARISAPPTQPSPLSQISLAALAGYGAPPAELWRSPAYVARVLRRRRELNVALRDARAKGRIWEVINFETARDSFDEGTFVAGVSVVVGALGLIACAVLVALSI